jgi:hypothetical protein
MTIYQVKKNTYVYRKHSCELFMIAIMPVELWAGGLLIFLELKLMGQLHPCTGGHARNLIYWLSP